MATQAQQLVAIARKQVGKPYVFGAEAAPNDPDPPAFDCSELVEWACARVGVVFPDGTWNQIAAVAGGTPAPRVRGVARLGARRPPSANGIPMRPVQRTSPCPKPPYSAHTATQSTGDPSKDPRERW